MCSALSCQNNLAKTSAFIWVKVDSWTVQRSRHLACLPLFQFHHKAYSRVLPVQVVFFCIQVTKLSLSIFASFHKQRWNLFSPIFPTTYVLQCIEKWLQGFRKSSGSTVVQHCKSCCQRCCCWRDLSVTCLLIMSDSCCEMTHRVFASLGQQVEKHKNIEFWK